MIVRPFRTEVPCKTEIPFFSALWETRGNLKGFLSSDLSPSRKRRELLSRLPLAGYLKCENHPVLFPLRVFHSQKATHHTSHITHHTSPLPLQRESRIEYRQAVVRKFFLNFSLFIFIYLLIYLFVYVFICFLLRLESQPVVITGSRNGWNIFLKYPSRRKLLYHSIANLNRT